MCTIKQVKAITVLSDLIMKIKDDFSLIRPFCFEVGTWFSTIVIINLFTAIC